MDVLSTAVELDPETPEALATVTQLSDASSAGTEPRDSTPAPESELPSTVEEIVEGILIGALGGVAREAASVPVAVVAPVE